MYGDAICPSGSAPSPRPRGRPCCAHVFAPVLRPPKITRKGSVWSSSEEPRSSPPSRCPNLVGRGRWQRCRRAPQTVSSASRRSCWTPSCGCAFHAACIDAWLRTSPTCPLCPSCSRALPSPPSSPRSARITAGGLSCTAVGGVRPTRETKGRQCPHPTALTMRKHAKETGMMMGRPPLLSHSATYLALKIYVSHEVGCIVKNTALIKQIHHVHKRSEEYIHPVV
jgi:hypothetical protein